MEKFVLIGRGVSDSKSKGISRITPSCYDKVYELRCATGISMARILEQCVDFALAHMDCAPYDSDCACDMTRGGDDADIDSRLPLRSNQKGGRKHG